MKQHKFQGIYQDGKDIYTKNLVPGQTVYSEKLVKAGKEEFREWDLRKSKLAAAIIKGVSQIGIKPGSRVLYLGASTGTTPSHVSDLVGNNGFIFAVEFAPRVARDFVFLCEKRKNLAPILADANHPEKYFDKVLAADVVYQDIAQKNQVEIFLKNCDAFLKKDGFGILCVKARSIDVSRNPRDLFREVRKELDKKITVVDYRELDPFEKDHCIYVCKKT